MRRLGLDCKSLGLGKSLEVCDSKSALEAQRVETWNELRIYSKSDISVVMDGSPLKEAIGTHFSLEREMSVRN